MKKLSIGAFAVALFFAVSIPLMAAETQEQLKTAPIEMSRLITKTATVEAVDQTNRVVALQGPNGTFNIKVGDEVRNLSQVKPGDIVNIAYYESLAAQVYKKGETPPSGSQSGQFIDRSAPGAMPGGTLGQSISITETVEAIDRTNNVVTLRAPDGSMDVEKAHNPRNLDKLDVGDKVVINYTQAVAIAVNRVSGD